MIKFTDLRKYVLGIGVGYATDTATGDIVFWSDKFQEGSISVTGSDQTLSAGIGNSPAIIIPTDPNVSVNITAANYDEYMKSASVGGVITSAAPAVACQTVAATGTSLTIDVTGGTPIAGPGMVNAVCYVQEVGAESPIATGGIAYPISAAGVISNFVATNGKTYLVTYYVSQANATMTTIGSNVKGKVVRFVLQRPIYVNVEQANNSGDMWGMLYEIIPRLQIMPDTSANSGSQTSYTMTPIVGRAVQYDAETISGTGCDSCSIAGAPLMYRVIVPCDATTGIDGIVGILGGEINMRVGDTFQMSPMVVVDNKIGASVPASDFTYISSATSYATVGTNTGLVTAAGAGDSVITVSYTVGTTTYKDYVDVHVTAS